MKKNLNDDTRYMEKFDDAPVQKSAGRLLILILIGLILLFGYLFFL
ncbi:MAG TPA: hypothetical protein VFW53_02140 [Gallionella sp.]|nr:hypothetical protein [Gallionella sp.]